MFQKDINILFYNIKNIFYIYFILIIYFYILIFKIKNILILLFKFIFNHIFIDKLFYFF